MRDDHGRRPGGVRLQTVRACSGRLVYGALSRCCGARWCPPLDELAADPDVISGGGEDFSAFVVSRWPRLVRLWLDATGKAFVSTTSLPESGHTQFQP
jgi:hypothetical protein